MDKDEADNGRSLARTNPQASKSESSYPTSAIAVTTAFLALHRGLIERFLSAGSQAGDAICVYQSARSRGD